MEKAPQGYVYATRVAPDLVKIGRSRRAARADACKAYVLEYEVLFCHIVTDMYAAELAAHQACAAYRIDTRELFAGSIPEITCLALNALRPYLRPILKTARR